MQLTPQQLLLLYKEKLNEVKNLKKELEDLKISKLCDITNSSFFEDFLKNVIENNKHHFAKEIGIETFFEVYNSEIIKTYIQSKELSDIKDHFETLTFATNKMFEELNEIKKVINN